MQDVLYVEVAGQAGALLHPLRIEVLKKLSEPKSCPDLAKELSETAQKIYYHVKILESAGLVDKVEERRVRGIMEGLYQARARSYWLSPRLVGRVGGAERAHDQMSLGFLLTLTEEIQSDVARLAERAEKEEVPSLGLSLAIELPDGETRARFLAEVREAFQSLAEKYGAKGRPSDPPTKDAEGFRLSLFCYPKAERRNTE